MKEKSNKKPAKLNWFTITNIHWKETVIFYLLTTLSCLLAFIIDENMISGAYETISKGEWNPQFKIFNKLIISDFGKLSYFLFFMAVLVVVYCLVVIIHVYYSHYLTNKINRSLKARLMKKLFRLRHTHDKKKVLNVLNNDTLRFTENVLFFPNQIFYLVLSVIFGLTLINAKGGLKTGGDIMWAGLGYCLIITVTIFFIDYFLYKRDLKFQEVSEEQTKKEDIAVNNRDLIIKKGLTSVFQNEYQKTVNYTWDKADKRDWVYTLSWVVPSFSLITYSDFFLLPFLYGTGGNGFLTLKVFNKIFNGLKKMIERLRNYPYYLSAQKRLNNFLAQEERDDIQKNILVNEPIESIILNQVSFGYEKNKMVIDKINLKFEKEKINYIKGKNGFGKSTIINLVVGLYQPDEGEILINEKYKMNEINLTNWREKKIAYAEHTNLVESNLSTGQKQWIDINNLFIDNTEKEVFIFDEADSALDKNNKKEFRQKLEKFSNEKLVILITHE